MKNIIENAWDDRSLLLNKDTQLAVIQVIDMLNLGKVRVVELIEGQYVVNEWVKKAILLYFSISKSQTYQTGIFEYYDKIPLKKDFENLQVRAVPPATVRYGAYIAPGAVLMPSYVNIGAYIGSGTMVDTWATVGSCAQIGENVHLSGGVGIGGVLEPLQASPVIIEDNCFIGSRAIVVEGAHLEKGVVLGANVVITKSSKIIDVTNSTPVEYKGFVPKNSVVIPGTFQKKFPAGDFQVACALIIGKRKESTDLKTSLNEILRDYEISV